MPEPRPHRCPGPQPFLPRSRREFLKAAGVRIRTARSGRLAGSRHAAAAAPAGTARCPRRAIFPAKAKRCIFLFMTGGPSQMDLFDPKPLLNRLDSQPLPPSFGKIHSQFLESRPALPGQPPQVGQVWPVGDGYVRPGPASPPACRRDRTDPLVLRRQRDPCSGHVSDEYRPRDHGLSQPGKLGHLWPGLRERRPAGVCRHDPARGNAGRGRALLGSRISCRRIIREPFSDRDRCRSSISSRPRASRFPSSAACSTCCDR